MDYIHMCYLKKRAERPRIEWGCDYGAKRAVLVRKGTLELQWRFACKSWTDRLGGYQHDPAKLILIDTHENIRARTISLHHSGGRLSKALVMCYQKKIDEFFGERTAELLGPSVKDQK